MKCQIGCGWRWHTSTAGCIASRRSSATSMDSRSAVWRRIVTSHLYTPGSSRCPTRFPGKRSPSSVKHVVDEDSVLLAKARIMDSTHKKKPIPKAKAKDWDLQWLSQGEDQWLKLFVKNMQEQWSWECRWLFVLQYSTYNMMWTLQGGTELTKVPFGGLQSVADVDTYKRANWAKAYPTTQ